MRRFFLFFLAGFLCQAGQATNVPVSSTADSGDGSLRDAIQQSNFTGGSNTIAWGSLAGGPISLASDLPSINGGTTLDVSNVNQAIFISGSGAMVLGGGVSFKNNSLIRDWTISTNMNGTGSLTKIGAGRLILTGANAYSGGTAVNAGTLNINGDSALGAVSGGLSLGGGTLQLSGTLNSARSIILNASGGTLDLNGNNAALSGLISGNGGLTVADSIGGHALTLSGANTYSGGTTINGATGVNVLAGAAGTLGSGGVIMNSGTGHADLNLQGFNQSIGSLSGDARSTLELGGAQLTVGSDGTSTAFSGIISDGGTAGSLVKTGGGILTLQGANTFSGGVTVNNGELSINSLGELGSGSVTLNGGGIRTNANMGFSRNVNLGASGGTIDTAGNTATFSGVLSGTGSLTVIGGGTLTLSGVNTYAGGTNMNGGILSVSTDNALGVARSTLNFNGGTLQTAAGFTTGRSVVLNSGGGTLDAYGRSSTFSGVFSDGVSSGSLIIADSIGGGKITLTGINAYGGGTTLNAGTLSIASDMNLGSSSGTLTFNGGTLQTTAGINSGRNITVNPGGAFIDTQGNNSIFSGVISGGGSLVELGSGSLFLASSNTYSGGTVLNTGTIIANYVSSLGSGPLTFNGAGTLAIANGGIISSTVTLAANGTFNIMGTSVTLSGTIGGAGSLSLVSTGTLTLSGANAYTGGTLVSAGVLGAGSSSALGTGALTLSGATLQTAADGLTLPNAITLGAGNETIDTNSFNLGLSGNISGNGSLTKISAGTLVLSGVNTYTGGTIVQAGTLQLGADQAAGTGSLSVSPGAIFDFSSHVQTVSSYGGGGSLAMTLPAGGGGTRFTVVNNANFTNGTLIVNLAPQVVHAGDVFTPIAYNGSRTSQFTSIVAPAALSFAPTYTGGVGAGAVQLTASLVPFANSAANSNQAAIGNGLEGLRVNPTGDVAALIGNLYTMNASQLQAAFDQVGPIALSSMRGVDLAVSGAQMAVVGRRAAALADGSSLKDRVASYSVSAPSAYPGTLIASSADFGVPGFDAVPETAGKSPWGFFASQALTTGRLADANTSSGLQPGYAFNAEGLTGGGDYRFNDNFAGGVALGYLHGHASIYAPGSGTVDNNSTRLGVYGAAFGERLRANFYAGGALDFYSTHRGINFGQISRTASARPRGTEFNAQAEGSWDMLRSHDWGILAPFAGLNYDRLMISPFTESGADSLDLSVGAQTAESLRSGLGLRLSNTFKSETYSWSPYASLGWRHEFDNQSRPINAQLASAGGGAFTVATGNIARDGTLTGLGFAIDWRRGISFKMDYSGDYRAHFQQSDVAASFRWRF